MIYSCVKEGWVRLDRRGNEKNGLMILFFSTLNIKMKKIFKICFLFL